MTATSSAKVWDLNDSSLHRHQQRRRFDIAGPIAAAFAVVSLAAALAPDLSVVARWCLVVGAGGIGVLIAGSSLRRRQTLVSLLIGLLGLVLPIAAVAISVSASGTGLDSVTSRVVPDAQLNTSTLSLSATPAFDRLPADQRTASIVFAVGLVTRIRAMSDPGPYPAALAMSGGVVVEDSGPYRGVSLGRLPDESRIVYSVSASGTVFSVTVVSTDLPGAAVMATNTGVLPHLIG